MDVKTLKIGGPQYCDLCNHIIKGHGNNGDPLAIRVCDECNENAVIPARMKQIENKNQKYNGWANYETWNIALWIQKDERLYSIALGCKDYPEFLLELENSGFNMNQITDEVSFTHIKLDIEELTQLINEINGDSI